MCLSHVCTEQLGERQIFFPAFHCGQYKTISCSVLGQSVQFKLHDVRKNNTVVFAIS